MEAPDLFGKCSPKLLRKLANVACTRIIFGKARLEVLELDTM